MSAALPGTVVLSSTATLFELKFTIARSSFPSPLRSPTATNRGPSPVAKSCLTANVTVVIGSVV